MTAENMEVLTLTLALQVVEQLLDRCHPANIYEALMMAISLGHDHITELILHSSKYEDVREYIRVCDIQSRLLRGYSFPILCVHNLPGLTWQLLLVVYFIVSKIFCITFVAYFMSECFFVLSMRTYRRACRFSFCFPRIYAHYNVDLLLILLAQCSILQQFLLLMQIFSACK